jgi:hypothetical protein
VDSGALADIIEELEQLRALSRAGLDVAEYEMGMFDAGPQLDGVMKRVQRYKGALVRLDELIKPLQAGSLDSGAIPDILEALEERKADYRLWLDECQKAKLALSKPIKLPEA